MKVKFKAFFIGVLFLGISSCVMADTIRLTLDEAIDLGLLNSTTIKQKLLAVNAARAAVQSSKSSYYPSVSVGANYTHLFKVQKTPDITFDSTTIPGSYVASSDPVSLSADLSQTVYTFGKLKNSVKIAEENLSLTELDFEEEKRHLTVEIKRAFYWVLLANEVLEVQKETMRYKEEALNVARKRFAAGLSPDYEVLTAESDVANFRPVVISAENQVKYAILAVMDLLGIKEEEGEFDIELIGALEPDYYDFIKSELIDMALKNKYEIKEYRKNISLMELTAEITKSGKKPSIAGFVNYTLQSGYDSQTGKPKYWGEDSWEGNLTTGVSVQMPLSALFPWSKENADIVKDTLDIEKLKLGLSSKESDTRLDIVNILLRLEEERSKILAGEKGVELALKLFRSSSERYENGMISSMELQDSQLTLNSAKVGWLQSIYNYKLALFDLMDAVGVDHF